MGLINTRVPIYSEYYLMRMMSTKHVCYPAIDTLFSVPKGLDWCPE